MTNIRKNISVNIVSFAQFKGTGVYDKPQGPTFSDLYFSLTTH